MEETIATEIAQSVPFYIEHIDAIVTVIVTILGFAVTYFMTKKNFQDEIKKNKIALADEQIQSLPYDICQLLDGIILSGDAEGAKKYSAILSKVLAYGSADAVKIAIKMQQISYSSPNTASLEERLPMMAAYSLLITQLKYDLTSEIITPESWFELKLKDYGEIREKMKKNINKLICELQINDAFKV